MLGTGDVTSPATVELTQGGDEVEGRVTLDGCGYDFTSEGSRVARRQVSVRGSGSMTAGYSNEVVAYRDAAAAALALEQFSRSVTECPPRELRESSVRGTPPTRQRLLTHRVDPAAAPVSPATFTVEHVTSESGQGYFASLVFQVRGDVLDGHYLITRRAPTKAQTAELWRQVSITGSRLLALPAR